MGFNSNSEANVKQTLPSCKCFSKKSAKSRILEAKSHQMPSCTCSSPDGSESYTYYMEEQPSSCENLCRFWDANSTFTRKYPYGSPEREAMKARMSCKMFTKECGSGPTYIQKSAQRTECVVGDKVGASITIDHGHGMGESVSISLRVIGDGATYTIDEADSPFFGQQVKTCAVNGFDDWVYWQTRNSSDALPIATAPWGQEIDVSTGADVAQGEIPVLAFSYPLEGEFEYRYWLLGLNPFFRHEAICSIEEYFALTGLDWSTIEHPIYPSLSDSPTWGCVDKVNILANAMSSANEIMMGINSTISMSAFDVPLARSRADAIFACQFDQGELLPVSDWKEIYNGNESEDLADDSFEEFSEECQEEGNPHDEQLYEVIRKPWGGETAFSYWDPTHPYGFIWWQKSKEYGGDDEYDFYLPWLRDYLIQEQGIEAFQDMPLSEVEEYHNTFTYNNWLASEEGLAYWTNMRENEACAIGKMYEEDEDFDWRGAHPPQTITQIIPSSIVGNYSWFNDDDVEEGFIVAQTFSETANEAGYESVPIPEGLVKLRVVSVPPYVSDEVRDLLAETQVAEDVNESRDLLTLDTDVPEGVFVPDDIELERMGAEDDFIKRMENGQISDEDLYKLFTADSAEEVAAMFDTITDPALEEELNQEEEAESQESIEQYEEEQEQNEEEEEVVEDILEIIEEGANGLTPYELQGNPDFTRSDLTPSKSKSAAEKPFYEKPAFMAIAGAALVGTIAYLIIERSN